jgi:hypothetical protein
MYIKKCKTIIFWMILPKFKEYTIQLTISVNTDEMGKKNLSKGLFFDYACGKTLCFFKCRSSLGWLLSKTSFRLLIVTMMDSIWSANDFIWSEEVCQ